MRQLRIGDFFINSFGRPPLEGMATLYDASQDTLISLGKFVLAWSQLDRYVSALAVKIEQGPGSPMNASKLLEGTFLVRSCEYCRIASRTSGFETLKTRRTSKLI